jgi:hypothetical protein
VNQPPTGDLAAALDHTTEAARDAWIEELLLLGGLLLYVWYRRRLADAWHAERAEWAFAVDTLENERDAARARFTADPGGETTDHREAG